ncbi:MAG: hypothetical protein ACLUFV_08535 [Acutalibacteraceae bacterium]
MYPSDGLHLTGALIRPAVQGFGVHTLFPAKPLQRSPDMEEYSASAAFVNPHAMRASKRRLIGIFTKLLPKYMCKMRIVI